MEESGAVIFRKKLGEREGVVVLPVGTPLTDGYIFLVECAQHLAEKMKQQIAVPSAPEEVVKEEEVDGSAEQVN